jgi:hypothetical protein
MGEIAVPIPLQFLQDPQGDVVLTHSRSECAVYFGCWTDQGEPAEFICQLQFDHAWVVRGYRSEYLPYQVEQRPPPSGVYRIENSTWPPQACEQRLKNYPEWRSWDDRKYVHYIVHGHDNYYEILASGFTEKKLPYHEAGELKRLADVA